MSLYRSADLLQVGTMPLVICYQLAQLDKIQGCGIGPQMGSWLHAEEPPLAWLIQKCMHLITECRSVSMAGSAYGRITQNPCSSDRGYWPQPCLELWTVSKMPSQFMYVFLEDPDGLSPSWPPKPFSIVSSSDESSLLLGLDSARHCAEQSACIFSSAPVRWALFSSSYRWENCSARSCLTFLGPHTHWLAGPGLQAKSCLTPEPYNCPLCSNTSLRMLHRALTSLRF